MHNDFTVRFTASSSSPPSQRQINFWWGAYRPTAKTADHWASLPASSAATYTVTAPTWFSASTEDTYLNTPGSYKVTASFTPKATAPKATALATFTVQVKSSVLKVGPGGLAPGTYRLPPGTSGYSYASVKGTTRGSVDGSGATSFSAPGTLTIKLLATDTALSFDACGGGPVKVA
jgi:hypothetical protein